jgi:hypothetical protein
MNSRFVLFLIAAVCASAEPPKPVAPLFGRVWQVARTGSAVPSGSIYIFLANGTLLMTSCVETYRIAHWTSDSKQPDTLRLTEDGEQTATLTLEKLKGSTARLTQTLVRGGKRSSITLIALDREFVCPDMPK